MSETVSAAEDDEKRSIGNIRFLVYIVVFSVVSTKLGSYLVTKGYHDPLSYSVGTAVGLLVVFPILRGYKALFPRGSRFTFLYMLKMIVVFTLLNYGIHYAVSFLFD